MGDNRYVGGASVMNARVAFTLALSLLASLPSLSITQGNDEWSMYGNNRYLAATSGPPGYSKWGNNGFSGLPGQNKWESRGPPGGRGPAGLVGNGHPGLNRNPTGWNKVDTDRPYEDTDDRETTYRPDLNDKGRRQSFDSDNRGRPQDPDSNNKGRPQGSNSDNRRSQSSDSDIRRILQGSDDRGKPQGPDSDNRRSYSPDSNIRGRLQGSPDSDNRGKSQGPNSDNRRPYSSDSNINRRIQDPDFDNREKSLDPDRRRPQAPVSDNRGRSQDSDFDNKKSHSSDSDSRGRPQGPDSDNRGKSQGPDSDNRRPYSSESNINRRIQDPDFDNRRKSLDPDSDGRRPQAPDSDSRGRLQDPDNRRSHSSDSNINRRIQSPDFDNREKSLDPDSDRRRPQTSVSDDRGRSQDPDFDNKKSHSSDSNIRGRSQSPVSDRRSEGPDSDNRKKLDDSDSDNRGRPQASVSNNKGRLQGPDSREPESNNYPRNQQCRKNEFRCGTNECLPQSVRCDNEIDCRDGSDEHACVGNRIQESNSQESNNNRQKNGCVLPEPPRGGRYNLSACDNDCDARPGNIVPKSSILNYTCNNNYVLKGNTISVCVDNKWLEPPTCLKVCPPLNSTSVDISCSYKGETVSCSKRIMPGTRATLACKSSYKLPLTNDPAYREISCLEDGLWDRRVFRCLPECGTSIGHGNTLIVNGFEAKLGIFPWHVGIYRKKRTTEYEQICGGNLISSTLVVSAAHCFYDEANNKLRKASEYAVAGGKRYRDWNAKEDYVQKSFVASIEAGARYMGARGNFANDIALLKLKTPFELTALVRPVCIDWDNTHEREQLQMGRTGKVVGWGKDIKGESTRSLQEIDMPFVPFHQCLSAVPIDFRGFLTPDKFCAGRLNGSSVCDGDSGGGLCFEKNGVWYLRGIVSVSPAKGGTCDYHSYVGFTYLSSFLDWIRDAYVSE